MQYNLQYSQNFLRDAKLVERLVGQSSVTLTDTVFEIGPGKGIITRELSKRARHVIAIEKDERIVEKLKMDINAENVTMTHADFLDYPLPQSRYKIFSNIPFTVTAAILKKIFNADNPPEDCYLILQHEPARKYAGQPYGFETFASLFYKPWFVMQILHVFKPGDFSPPPSVTAVLLQIRKREPPLLDDSSKKAYRDFISYVYLQNKLTLKQKCKKIFTHEQWKRLAKDLNFQIHAKVLDITFGQWLGLFRYFLSGVTKEKQAFVKGVLDKLRARESQLKKMHRSRH